MKRSVILTLAVALFAPISLIGCGEETKVEKTEKVSTPTGSTEKVETDKVKTTGDATPETPAKP